MDFSHNFNNDQLESADNIVKTYFRKNKLTIAFKEQPLILNNFNELILFLEKEYPVWEKTMSTKDLSNFKSKLDNAIKQKDSYSLNNNINSLLNHIKTINKDKVVAFSKSSVGKYIMKMSEHEAKGFLFYLTGKPLIRSNSNDSLDSRLFSGVFLGLLYEKGFVKKKEIQAILDSPNFVLDSYQSEYEENIEELNKIKKELTDNSVELKSYINELEDSTREEIKKIKIDWEERIKYIIDERQESIKKLEEQYGEKLKLKGPALYWKDLASTNHSLGIWWSVVSLIISIIGGGLIWWVSMGIDISETENLTISIQRYLVIGVVISIVFFLLNQSIKVTLSRFHLSNDYKEREQLTMVYLALLGEDDKEVSNEEKQIILQSIFSRSDSGLMKGDTGPTLPNNTLNQILNQIRK